IFKNPLVAWFVSSLGAFPVRRGAGDPDMMATARAILERGDSVLIFPEGTRTRPGSLGRPKRGVGRLALETGAPVSSARRPTPRLGRPSEPGRVRVPSGKISTESPRSRIALAVAIMSGSPAPRRTGKAPSELTNHATSGFLKI